MADVLLGPIVGHVTAQTARTWLRSTVPAKQARLQGAKKISASELKSEEHGIVVADFDGLAADTVYSCEFLDASGNRLGALATFRTLPEQPMEFAFAFASCNREPAGGLWGRLHSSLAPESLRLLLLCGDQIYSDDRAPNIWSQAYANQAEALASWQERYLEQWSQPEVATVLRSVPTYMMWDDHEIADDWGSDPSYLKDIAATGSNVTKIKYAAARRAYEQHQRIHGLPLTGPATNYGFLVGTIAFYVLDVRSERGRDPFYPVLGKKQLDAFTKWLAKDAKNAELLFVVSPVPLAHIGSILLDYARANKMELDFDASDQWVHPNNAADLERVLDLLFDWQNDTPIKRRAYVIGGDVHVATAAELQSERKKHSNRWKVFQFTSSAIANVIDNKYLGLAHGIYEQAIRDDIRLADGYRSVNKEVILKRNFGIVRTKRKPTTGTWEVEFQLVVEGLKNPKTMMKVPF